MYEFPRRMAKWLTVFFVAQTITGSIAAYAAETGSGASSTASTLEEAPLQSREPDDKEGSKRTDESKDKPMEEGKGDGAQAQASALTAGQQAAAGAVGSSSKKLIPQPDLISGALTSAYPLAVPPGRNGIAPQLALGYSSQNTSEGSIVGYGWTLDIPSIERLNKTGADRLYTDGSFSSSLSGELVNVSGSNYRAKVESGDFLEYAFSANAWTVKDKRGTMYKFGSTAATRQDNPSDTTKVAKWMLEEIRDTNDNFVRYEYFKDAGQVYPSKAKYTGSGSTDGMFEVEFLRQVRPDITKSYQTAFQVTTTYRINEIQTKVSGTWVKKYTLDYASGNNGARSLLTSITESGRDGAGTVTSLPAHRMVHSSGAAALNQDTAFAFPLVPEIQGDGTVINVPFNLSDPAVRVMDINGDGLKDIVKSRMINVNNISKPLFWVLRNMGNGFVVDPSWSQPTYSFTSEGETFTNSFTFGTHMQVGDWNGDLRDDLIYFSVRNGTEQSSVVLINTGSAWIQDTSVTTDVPSYLPCDSQTPALLYVTSSSGSNRRFMDLNGDGLLDYIFANNYGVNCSLFTVFYNRNGKLVYDPSITQPWITPGGQTPPQTIPFVLSDSTQSTDINGDGLIDFLFISTSQQDGVENVVSWALVNTGRGWVQDPSFIVPRYSFTDLEGNLVNLAFATTTSSSFLAADVNGDGLSDWIRMWSLGGSDLPEHFRRIVLLHNGRGWIQRDDVLTVNPYTYLDADQVGLTRYPNTSSTNALMLDINGDGLVDMINAQSSVSGANGRINWALINGGQTSDLVKSITNPTGGVVGITYKSSSQYKNGSALLNPNLPMNMRTVSSLTADNGHGVTTTSGFSYEGGRYYFASGTDRRFAGFAKVTSTDASGDKSLTFYHQGDSSNSTQGEYQDHASKIGKVYRTEAQDSAGNKFTVGITKWERTDLGNGSSFVFPSTVLSQSHEGGTTHRDRAASSTYDALGNPTQSKDWGEVAGNNDGTFTDVSDGIVITNTSYAASAGSAVKAAPCVVSVLDGSNTLLSEARSYYDSLALCQVGKGNATKSEKLLIGTGYYASTVAYNTYGLPTSTTDWKGNATTIAYDTNALYPATVTNALGHVVTSTVDLTTGQARETTDPNGAKTRNTYDGLGRSVKTEINDPAAPASFKTAQTVSYADTAVPLKVMMKRFNGVASDPGVEEIQYLDGFGNLLQSRSTAEGSNQYTVTSRTYDTELRVLKEMLPVFQSGSAYLAPSASDRGNQFTYDALGRVTVLSNAVGTITTAYTPWKVEVTDANGHKKRSYEDGRGNMAKVEEINGAATYTTTYTYDLLKRLTKIADAENSIRDYTYDSLGRLLSQNMLHANGQAASSYGSWTYAYDANDSVMTKTDPKGQVITYTYDVLNRLKTEDFTGQTGTEVTNTYDTGTYGKGRVASVSSQGITTAYAYDLLGRATGTTWTVDAVARTQTATYDLLGNPKTVAYPNGKTVTMTYNNAYLPTTITEGSNTLVSNVDYSPTGAVTKIDFGNGTSTVNTYDIAKLYRLTGKVTTKGATQYQNLTYTYDAAGNITSIVEAAPTAAQRNVAYAYDDLDRLISASYATGTSLSAPSSATMTSPEMLSPPAPTADKKGSGIPSTPAQRFQLLRNTGTSPFSSAAAAATAGVDIAVTKTDGRSTIMSGEWNTYSITATNYGSAQAAYAYVYDLIPAKYNPATVVVSCATCYYTEGNGTAEAYAEMALSAGQSVTLTISAQVKSNQTGTISNTAESGYWDGGTDTNPANNTSTDTTSIGSATPTPTPLPSPTPSPTPTPTPTPSATPTPTPTPPSVQSFTYSATGNMLSSGLGTYLYEKAGYANPQAVTKVATNRTYAYDKDGNLTGSTVAGVANTYTYDYRDRMVGSKKGSALDIVYQYDHGYNRVKKWDKNGNKVSLYFGDFEMEGTGDTTGKLTTTTLTRINVALGGGQGVSLEYNGSGTLVTKAFHHTDHLTGSSIETDASGNLLETLDYHPYGAVRVNTKAGTYENKKKFTGKELDSESGLTYFGARYYDADIGRWMGWDPIQQDPATLVKSGELNGYGYVSNNPLKYIDQYGFDKTILLNGTDLSGLHNGGAMFDTQQGKDMVSNYGQTFGTSPEDTLVFRWSGDNNSEARTVAAHEFDEFVRDHVSPDEKLFVVGYSHGGNVAIEATHYMNRPIDLLLTLETPVRDDYAPKAGMIGRHIQTYS